jgi:thiamine biosynthesis lipoprotein
MKEIRLIMGMPITVEIADTTAGQEDFAAVFDYFTYIDEKFSTYKPESEMMKINRGELAEKEWSNDMSIILMLAEETKQRTNGFFDIKKPDGSIDPSGIVKGWAIFQAAKLLEERGFKNFYIDAGGDIQTQGKNTEGDKWSVGIRNPFVKNSGENDVIKTVHASGEGVATSGTYIRGEHIYNPHRPTKMGAPTSEIVSLTVIGPNIYEADRFATAAFAMGAAGIHFIEGLPGFEGYMVNKEGIATMTDGFEKYVKK